MKQVLQNFKTGELSLMDIPAPVVRPEGILIRTQASLISAGTERSVIGFAEKSLLDKARSRPDLVKQVMDKAKREGILTTYEAVQNRLEQLLPLGYSSAGEIIEVGASATGFKTGDRVACGGMGYASHAEFAYVPRTLAVKIPDNVSYEEASFATLGAIAMQGVRQAEVSVGDCVGVIGLGLLGKLTAQILQASGCRVFGCDTSAAQVASARDFGCDDASLVSEASDRVRTLAAGRGLDCVIITAQSEGSEPTELAGELARLRGVVVAVGEVGMDIPRRSYYMKELDFRLSRSYGPGRYDPEYEDHGHDYPFAYVRWTEQRNMESFLQLVAAGKVNLKQQISHRFPIARAEEAYALITGKSGEPYSSVVLTYDTATAPSRKLERATTAQHSGQAVKLGVIGAGSFASSTLLPAIKDAGDVTFSGIASANGISARTLADRYGFAFCATSAEQVLDDARVNTVAILTRHDLHASQVIAALKAKKSVFVEKPLALNEQELEQIEQAYEGAGSPPFLVGFNRRFAPYCIELREAFSKIDEPRMIDIRVNAGYIPPEHWIHDPAVGGGRLLGEGCHFFDLLHFFADSSAVSVNTSAASDSGKYRNDNFVSVVRFANGSVGTVTYVANGDRQAGKERIEVFCGGVTGRIDDFHDLRIFAGKRKINRTARLRSDKGHRAEWSAFIRQINGKGPVAHEFAEACAAMRTTFAAQQSMLRGKTVLLRESGDSRTSGAASS